MFTVKTIIDNTVQQYEIAEPTIGLPGSALFDQVMQWLLECNNREADYMNSKPVEVGDVNYGTADNWQDLGAFDFLEFHPPTFLDAECKNCEYPEQMITGERRAGMTLGQCIGVLILSCDNPERIPTDNPYLKGCLYQLIYPGDALFTMNSAGTTTHVLR